MRITKQPSAGRGEYELSEYAPNGLSPHDMLGRTIKLRLGDLGFDTAVKVTNAQGKYRLRLNPSSPYPHVHLQVAHALLLPGPVRSEQIVTGGEPVLRNGNYIIKNIHFGEVVADPEEPFFTAEALMVDGANRTVEAKQVPVTQRIQDIERIWERRNEFASDISRLLKIHEEQLRSSNPIPRTFGKLVRDLQEAVEVYGNQVDVLYTKTTDVLPALLAVLNEQVTVTSLLSIAEIEPDQIPVLRREISRWQQFVRRRGVASVQFRRDVQKAYNYSCLMCGGRFPSTSVNLNPGVDAAHILPWAEYDLDRVVNGISLCKIHHWAFDERLLQIKFYEGNYFIELSEDAREYLNAQDFGLDILQQVVGMIPRERLPTDVRNWPNPDLLERFYSASA